MAIDIFDAIVDLLASNRSVDPRHSDFNWATEYGVAANLTTEFLELTLTFRRGRAYCCAEWGCHLGLFEGERWLKLRQSLLNRNITAPDPMRLRLRCLVEAGALFFDFSRPDSMRRGQYALESSAAFNYEVSVQEGVSPIKS